MRKKGRENGVGGCGKKEEGGNKGVIDCKGYDKQGKKA
jgi:hypothetical protein